MAKRQREGTGKYFGARKFEDFVTHVASILGQLGAANRTDAVRLAVRRGLISL